MNAPLPEIWDRFGPDAPWNQEDPPEREWRWWIEWLDETGHSRTTEIDAAHWQGACDDLLDQHTNAEIVSVTDEYGEKVEI